MEYVIAVFVIGLLASALFFGHRWEAERFNQGNCPGCEKPWCLFDVDSQGGRGYTCRPCNRGTWVSYGSVDGGGVF